MSDFRFELNKAGVAELLKSNEMANVLAERAEAIRAKCGSGYETDTYQAGTRVIASVYAADDEAIQDNYDNETIMRALG